MNKHIIDNVNFYLKLDEPQYAILLTGSWGSGKTYFINEYIKQKIEESKTNKFIKVSLFGLRSLSEIEDAIFQELHPILGSKYAKITGAFLKSAIKFGIKLDLDGNGKEETSLSPDMNKLINFKEGKELNQEYIFVFDDLERTEIKISEILGYINYLVEQSKVKVIILANEQAIQETEKYNKFKEKVIGCSFEVRHDFSSVLDFFLHDDDLVKYKEEIFEANSQCKNVNLRIIHQTINDFNFFFEKINKVYLENEFFVQELVTDFFYRSIILKKGNKQQENFEKSGKKDKSLKKRNPKISLFSNVMWKSILETRDIDSDELNSSIEKLAIFKPIQVSPAWVKLWRFSILENDEFASIRDEVISDFKRGHFDNPEVFLHLVGLFIELYNNKISELNVDDIEEIVEETLREDRLAVFFDFDKDLNFNSTGLEYYSLENDFFQKIHKRIGHHNNNRIQIQEEMKINQNVESIWKAIQENDLEKVYEIFSENRSVLIFKKGNAKSILKSLTSCSNESILSFRNKINYRYNSNDTLNNQLHYYYLKGELPFWIEFKQCLDGIIIKYDSVKKINLTLLQKVSEKLFKNFLNKFFYLIGLIKFEFRSSFF